MDDLLCYDCISGDFLGDTFLAFLRENLKCFFEVDFTVSYNTLSRIIDDYNKISNPDFFIEITMSNIITVIFVERKNHNA